MKRNAKWAKWDRAVILIMVISVCVAIVSLTGGCNYGEVVDNKDYQKITIVSRNEAFMVYELEWRGHLYLIGSGREGKFAIVQQMGVTP